MDDTNEGKTALEKKNEESKSMKQHITEEQFNELSEKGKKKLRKWWKPKEGDWIINKSRSNNPVVIGNGCMSPECECQDLFWPTTYKEDCFSLLSIGQMIEFLRENHNEISLGFNDSGVFWHVHVGIRGTGNMMRGFGKTYDSNEDDLDLVDALWEAVKEVLNEKSKKP